MAPGKHLAQKDSESEDVGSRVGGLSFQLLGRHVRKGSQDGAAVGQHPATCFRLAVPEAITRNFLGEAEIQHLHVAFIGDRNVVRLQVAMNDSFLVRSFQSLGNLVGNSQGLVYREGPFGQPPGQRLALGKLHRQEVYAVRFLEVVDRGDVRVIDSGQHLGFTLQASQPIGVVRQLLG